MFYFAETGQVFSLAQAERCHNQLKGPFGLGSAGAFWPQIFLFFFKSSRCLDILDQMGASLKNIFKTGNGIISPFPDLRSKKIFRNMMLI